MAEISRDEVAHLAKLSRLALSEEELAQFAGQIDDIIDHVKAVQQVDAAGVEPMSHPHNIRTTMREDVVTKTLTAEQALDQAPEVQEQRFVVPRILDGEGE
ncbi:Asp-tRNA(Asn)/Glu-tRNA(Gln) amidotransferase subunit GatC [Corynebacterium poyangense]|uniref:Aspartyl/glutamyl-tRNA(Asn/Gln) amidotransferase subunit C n=1 Tax=Corynebacterium poyangense TaxID=2684405 RepID=A0A7H0SNF6_9CORY|nr:Asp-tRNA(Asn)/Glu-tRNA(Gln) amidotransferase subunit GatC [Corynebacterium poyangense]MBZ8177111.1 Asp-tRNA(Asn)/Glu-tRNA(Gln) amidotransferase subunit GatC [Corynebacterium poyangense]QNQ90081.1 Asp-tRNA(Asn)/Glu-tRNA(Gln) amidotransferase subunit GatC [Corynebacterium poyangense]